MIEHVRSRRSGIGGGRGRRNPEVDADVRRERLVSRMRRAQREQTGQLVLRRSGLTVTGGWVPYWRFDTLCVEASVAERIAERFDVELRPVGWPSATEGDAFQIVVPTVGES